MRLTAAVVAVTTLVSATCASGRPVSVAGAGAVQMSFLLGGTRISTLRVAPDTSYRRARRYFGALGQRGSPSFSTGTCRLGFARIGLYLSFLSLTSDVGTPASCTILGDAVARGPSWHTANGLRVGATSRSLRRLFPRASAMGRFGGQHWRLPAATAEWWLTGARFRGHAAHTILVAYVKEGRVVALGVLTVGH